MRRVNCSLGGALLLGFACFPAAAAADEPPATGTAFRQGAEPRPWDTIFILEANAGLLSLVTTAGRGGRQLSLRAGWQFYSQMYLLLTARRGWLNAGEDFRRAGQQAPEAGMWQLIAALRYDVDLLPVLLPYLTAGATMATVTPVAPAAPAAAVPGESGLGYAAGLGLDWLVAPPLTVGLYVEYSQFPSWEGTFPQLVAVALSVGTRL